MRVLLISEMANPERVSVPLEGWSHARALQRLVGGHVVTHVRNADAWAAAGAAPEDYTTIDNEWIARPMHRLEQVLRRGRGTGWTTSMALRWLPYRAFEAAVWDRFGDRLRAGEFDLVHRITPLSPTVPSPIARHCARTGVPFVLGPLNGGLPWPKGFDTERRREHEWLSYVRGAYRMVPGYRSTRDHAAAIVVGSRATFEQVPQRWRGKCVYIPENAIDPQRFEAEPAQPAPPPVRAVFVGRLVPYKGCDMLLEAAAGLLGSGLLELEIVGDGPERPRLEQMAKNLGVADRVTFSGWVEHGQLAGRLAAAHLFAFPSIREFGGAVVLEAMAMGCVPVVMDYGGPGELVAPGAGVAVPMGHREQIISRFRDALERLAHDPGRIPPMSARARRRAFAHFTWEAKAQQVREVYRWALGERDKPDFGMPLADEDPPAHEAAREREAAGMGV